MSVPGRIVVANRPARGRAGACNIDQLHISARAGRATWYRHPRVAAELLDKRGVCRRVIADGPAVGGIRARDSVELAVVVGSRVRTGGDTPGVDSSGRN